MDPIVDIEAWIIANSKGADGSFGLRQQKLSDDQSLLIELFQLGVFIDDIRAHRSGSEATERLMQILSVVDVSRDMPNFVVYRGLLLDSTLRAGDAFGETSISSWSIYPSIAMRLALDQGHGMVTILRYRLLPQDPSLYIDDWEYEVLRGPYSHRMGPIVTGSVNYMSTVVDVRVVDLTQETRDE